MSIVVTPIPRLIDLAAPSFTLGTANAAGSAVTAVASDATLLAFDTTNPSAVAASAVVGSATTAPRRDHVHPGTTESAVDTLIATHTAIATAHQTIEGAKVWGQTTAAGIVETPTYNVASVTDTGTGDRLVNFTVVFSSTVFSILSACAGAGYTAESLSTGDADKCRVKVYDGSHNLADAETFFAMFGDQ